MARRETRDEDIRKTTEVLSRRYGLDQSRVRRVLERTARDFLPQAIDQGSPAVYFEPSLEDALECCPAQQALILFEDEKPETLVKRTQAAGIISNLGRPFYTLQELENLIEAYLLHMEKNQQALLRMGYPRTCFDLSKWLDNHLGQLYPVKFPAGRALLKDKLGDFEYLYNWEDKTHAFSTDRGIFGFHTYEDANLIDGLNPTDAERLDRERPKILDLQIRLLELLRGAIHKRSAESLRKNCIRLFTDCLTSSEFKFYLRTDSRYTSLAKTSSQRLSTDVSLEIGGITDWLLLIWHVERELTLGRHARLKDAILKIADAEGIMRPFKWYGKNGMFLEHREFTLLNEDFDYYDAIGRPWQRQIDDAFDQFMKRPNYKDTFWKELEKRLPLTADFYEKEETRRRSIHKFTRGLRPYIHWFAQEIKTPMESSGGPPPFTSIPLQPKGLRDEYAFRLEGDYWTVIFEGKVARLKDSLGLRYIRILLEYSEKEFLTWSLFALVRDEEPREQISHEPGTIAELPGDAGPIVDAQGIRECRQKLEDLQNKRDEAQSFNNQERVNSIQADIDCIAGYLRGALGLGRRSRKALDPSEKVRKSVGNAITRAKAQIADVHPTLSEHLKTIVTGDFCSYEPQRSISWTF